VNVVLIDDAEMLYLFRKMTFLLISPAIVSLLDSLIANNKHLAVAALSRKFGTSLQ
jgi:hypothetical protein